MPRTSAVSSCFIRESRISLPIGISNRCHTVRDGLLFGRVSTSVRWWSIDEFFIKIARPVNEFWTSNCNWKVMQPCNHFWTCTANFKCSRKLVQNSFKTSSVLPEAGAADFTDAVNVKGKNDKDVGLHHFANVPVLFPVIGNEPVLRQCFTWNLIRRR